MATVDTTTRKLPFWRRQFSDQPTQAQIGFDATFGIVLPLICVALDPFVFRSTFGEPLLGAYAVGSYVAIGLGMTWLAFWLAMRRLPAVSAGLLAGGAMFSLALGCALFPFSLVGLAAGIGALGFAPLATAFAFWRNAARAFRAARTRRSHANVAAVSAFALAAACAIPLGSQVYVSNSLSRAVELLRADDAAANARGVAILSWFGAVADLDRLVLAYESETNTIRRQRLAAAYWKLTGEEVEDRLMALRD